MAVYLDYNATTPTTVDVRQAISDALVDGWGNPSSSYATGQEAARLIKLARQRVGNMVGSSNPEAEITFTSGGTESNHLALWSAVQAFKRMHPSDTPHIVTSNIEHVAIELPLKEWTSKGIVEVDFVKVDPNGRIRTADVIDAVKDNTCLVTVMAANNETGVIQPIDEIGIAIKNHNITNKCKVLFHTDASQIFGKVEVPVGGFHVDYLTICGHKFYGPRIGALFHRKETAEIHPLLFGGGQEFQRRPGTENTPMIVGLGKAAEMVTVYTPQWIQSMEKTRTLLERELTTKIGSAAQANFPQRENVLPNTLSIRLEGCEGWRVLEACRGQLEASTASACHSGSCAKPSPVLVKSGLTDVQAISTLRLSLSYFTTEQDVIFAVGAIAKAVGKMSVKSI